MPLECTEIVGHAAAEGQSKRPRIEDHESRISIRRSGHAPRSADRRITRHHRGVQRRANSSIRAHGRNQMVNATLVPVERVPLKELEAKGTSAREVHAFRSRRPQMESALLLEHHGTSMLDAIRPAARAIVASGLADFGADDNSNAIKVRRRARLPGRTARRSATFACEPHPRSKSFRARRHRSFPRRRRTGHWASMQGTEHTESTECTECAETLECGRGSSWALARSFMRW